MCTYLQAVGPGDRLAELPAAGQVRVGPGIQPEDNLLVASKAGVLRQTKGGKLWIEGKHKRCGLPETSLPWFNYAATANS